MHYTGEVYRHPMEGYTQLLEVTIGCSHNKCSFCTMYRRTPFKMSPLADIEEDLLELKSLGAKLPRVYLVNADPFVLSTNKLVAIAKLIRSYFPELETITGYASIKNLKNKSLEDLITLRKLGYNDLHIGLETAYDPALEMMNKGFNQSEAYEQLHKVKEAGMRYDALLMLGVAGKGMGQTNMDATVALLNATQPYMISIMPTSVTPGSELEILCNSGDYVELTEREMIEEEIALLNSLELDPDSYFFGSHNYNLVPVSGKMKDKQDIIKHLEKGLDEISSEVLDSVKPRGAL